MRTDIRDSGKMLQRNAKTIRGWLEEQQAAASKYDTVHVPPFSTRSLNTYANVTVNVKKAARVNSHFPNMQTVGYPFAAKQASEIATSVYSNYVSQNII